MTVTKAPARRQARRSGSWVARWSSVIASTPIQPRRAKYRAEPTVVHGFRFASKAEARRYQELLYRGMAGELRNLELQPRFPITVNGERVADYIADFRYQERRVVVVLSAPIPWCVLWVDVVEDVKGMKTPVYRLKKKLVEAQYGIQIREVR